MEPQTPRGHNARPNAARALLPGRQHLDDGLAGTGRGLADGPAPTVAVALPVGLRVVLLGLTVGDLEAGVLGRTVERGQHVLEGLVGHAGDDHALLTAVLGVVDDRLWRHREVRGVAVG